MHLAKANLEKNYKFYSEPFHFEISYTDFKQKHILESWNEYFDFLRNEENHSKNYNWRIQFQTRNTKIKFEIKSFCIKDPMNKIRHTFALMQPLELSLDERRHSFKKFKRFLHLVILKSLKIFVALNWMDILKLKSACYLDYHFNKWSNNR